MIYQELALGPHLTVEANVMLGRSVRAGIVRRGAQRRIVAEGSSWLAHPDIRPRRRPRAD